MDLVQPQVFFSYNWGHRIQKDGSAEYSTQHLVIPLCHRVEVHTELLVWLDVRGGMGVGDNHIHAMLDGIKKATVVVIFFSDAYINSPNCQREYLHAVRASKFIVPVLVPADKRKADDLSSDPKMNKEYRPNSGWTGEYDSKNPSKDWWHHIYTVVRKDSDGHMTDALNDPDCAGKAIDWSFLGRFQPIDMRDEDQAFQPGSNQEMEIIKKIMSRFHRGAHIDHQTARQYSQWKQDSERLSKLLKFFDKQDIESLTMETIQETFGMIDKDKSGTIDAKEIELFFTELGEPIGKETAEKLLAEADADQSSTIDITEFKRLITELFIAHATKAKEKKIQK